MKLMNGRRRVAAGLIVSSIAVAVLFFAFGAAGAGAALTGASAQKNCNSPTKIGDPVVCTYAFVNNDDFGNNETVSSLVDVTQASGGAQSSGNILSSVGLIFDPTPNAGSNPNAFPSCTGGSGAGTEADPYFGATSCTVPVSIVNVLGQNFTIGARLRTTAFSWYTATPADFNLPGHALTDQDDFTWKCTTGNGSSCDANQNNHAQAPAQTILVKRASQTATDIHNAAHTVVTTVAVGSTVHDLVKVTSNDPDPSQPVPTGNVNVDWFLNGDCSGNPVANSGSVGPLNANGQFDATAFNFTVNSAGFRSFKAHYEGDGVYNGSDGACEPLRVVDASIQITPNGVNHVGQNHTFTAHVSVDDGTGPVSAPDGTQVSFSIDSGPGVPNPPASCTTTGGNGSCQTTISSATTGVTTVSAHTVVSVGGVVLTRSTDGVGANSGPAVKTWVSARISIAPNATNEVGHSHTFTVTLEKDTGTGTFVAAAGESVSVSLAPSGGAAVSPAGPFTGTTDAQGHFAVTFVSNTAGKVTGTATSTLAVAGSAPFTVQTDGVAPNSGPAVKTFVDANIQISPLSAINPVGKNHTLTGHVNVNTGGGSFVNAPDGTAITFSLLSGPATFVGASSCQTSGGTGSCSVNIVSTTPGTSVIRAATNVSVGGVALARATGDAKVGDSADASKLWADDAPRTDILNAAGAVITTAQAGTVVHDQVQVARVAGTPAGVPNPTGTVVFHRYTTNNCTGTPTNQSVTLTAGSPSTAVSDAFAVTADMSYQAEYLGDANYPAHLAACEPLAVTPVPQPAIAIVKNPKGQTVAAGGTAKFSITVTNTGNTVLTDVTVTDPLSPNCNRTKAQIPALASMAPGAAVTYSCSRPSVQAPFDNVATATGTPPSGPNVTATDTAPVKVKALTPKKVIKKKKPKVVTHKKPKATG